MLIVIQLYFDNVRLSRKELEKQINATIGVSRLWQLVKRLPMQAYNSQNG